MLLVIYPPFLLLLLLFSSSCISSRTIPILHHHRRHHHPTTRSTISISNTYNNYNYNWKEFVKFKNAKKGSNIIKGLSKLKEYFHHFGYLKVQETNDFTDMFDAKFEVALSKYQAKLGLKITRKLDYETLAQILSPRCGVQDMPLKISRNTTIRSSGGFRRQFQHGAIDSHSHMLNATRDYAFFTDQPRWIRTSPITLTYGFSPENSFIPSLSKKETRDAFRLAFSHWASVIPVTFSETDDYGFADIKIGFYFGDHGDTEPFDGVLGVLAHAFAPESGRFHLDAAETWAVDFNVEKSDVAVDLESVATHEIGHLLGLGHSSVKEAVMYPSLKPRDKKVDLNVDDIKGIQALYGTNPNFTIEALSESYISSNNAIVVRVYWSFLSWCFLLIGFIQVLLFF